MSNFRRILLSSVLGTAHYDTSFLVQVNEDSKVYCDNNQTIHTGIGFEVNIGGWRGSMTHSDEATAK
jgi:hypothetical protein